jgi:hypothetical protein
VGSWYNVQREISIFISGEGKLELDVAAELDLGNSG